MSKKDAMTCVREAYKDYEDAKTAKYYAVNALMAGMKRAYPLGMIVQFKRRRSQLKPVWGTVAGYSIRTREHPCIVITPRKRGQKDCLIDVYAITTEPAG